jgi:hypothetical protein
MEAKVYGEIALRIPDRSERGTMWARNMRMRPLKAVCADLERRRRSSMQRRRRISFGFEDLLAQIRASASYYS